MSRPKFWRSLQIKLSKKTFNKRLESERFRLVRSVKLKKSLTEEQLERFFLNIREYNLRGLEVWTNLTSISGDVLSETAVSLEDIKLEHSHLTPYQVNALFLRIVSTEELRLKKLSVGRTYLSAPSPDLSLGNIQIITSI